VLVNDDHFRPDYGFSFPPSLRGLFRLLVSRRDNITVYPQNTPATFFLPDSGRQRAERHRKTVCLLSATMMAAILRLFHSHPKAKSKLSPVFGTKSFHAFWRF